MPPKPARRSARACSRPHAALAVAPACREPLSRLPPAEASWPWLDLVFGGGVSFAPGGSTAGSAGMLALELTQMAQTGRRGRCGDRRSRTSMPARFPPAARNRYLEAALDDGNPSKPLRAAAGDAARQARAPRTGSRPGGAPAAVRRKARQPPAPQPAAAHLCARSERRQAARLRLREHEARCRCPGTTCPTPPIR